MHERDQAAIDAAYADRVCELFRALCLGYEGHNSAAALQVFAKGLEAAQRARDAAGKL